MQAILLWDDDMPEPPKVTTDADRSQMLAGRSRLAMQDVPQVARLFETPSPSRRVGSGSADGSGAPACLPNWRACLPANLASLPACQTGVPACQLGEPACLPTWRACLPNWRACLPAKLARLPAKLECLHDKLACCSREHLRLCE